VTAEEAQDYPQAAGQESGHVRDSRTPDIVPATAVTSKPEPVKHEVKATFEDMERSRLGVSRAASVGRLEKMQSTVEERLKSGFYSPAQADELLNLINGKLDILGVPEDDGQEFPHEAAEHEVTA